MKSKYINNSGNMDWIKVVKDGSPQNFVEWKRKNKYINQISWAGALSKH